MEESAAKVLESLERVMGFEPHSVAGSALNLASRLLQHLRCLSSRHNQDKTMNSSRSGQARYGAGDGI